MLHNNFYTIFIDFFPAIFLIKHLQIKTWEISTCILKLNAVEVVLCFFS